MAGSISSFFSNKDNDKKKALGEQKEKDIEFDVEEDEKGEEKQEKEKPKLTLPEKMQKSYNTFNYMMKRAKEYGLEQEVFYDFTRYLKAGNSVEEAASAALIEWDV